MLLEYREKHRLTQKQMAEMLGVSIPGYCLYENHMREMPLKIMIKFLKIRDENYDEEAVKIIEKFLRWI